MLLAPRAGKWFPAGSADWQGCSHQRPPTTYLEVFLFHSAYSPLGKSGCVPLGYENRRLSPQPAELLCPPELASVIFNSLNSLDWSQPADGRSPRHRFASQWHSLWTLPRILLVLWTSPEQPCVPSGPCAWADERCRGRRGLEPRGCSPGQPRGWCTRQPRKEEERVLRF